MAVMLFHGGWGCGKRYDHRNIPIFSNAAEKRVLICLMDSIADEPFDLPVTYKKKELYFPARLLLLGYTHKFEVQVNGQTVLFEPDEERNYRAVVDPEQLEKSKLDVDLLKSIAGTLETIVK